MTTYKRMQHPKQGDSSADPLLNENLERLNPNDDRVSFVAAGNVAAMVSAGWVELGGEDLVEMNPGGGESVLVPARYVQPHLKRGWTIT